MLLWEIFDHAEELVWQRSGKFELASFTIKNIQYIVQIEKRMLPHNIADLIGKMTAEVSFYTTDDNSEIAHSTTKKATTSSSKVYGAVMNALLDKFSNYDAFYFTAEQRHSKSVEEFEQKKNFYSTMSDRVSKRTGAFYYENHTASFSEFLVSKMQLSKDTQMSTGLKNLREEALKECGYKKLN